MDIFAQITPIEITPYQSMLAFVLFALLVALFSSWYLGVLEGKKAILCHVAAIETVGKKRTGRSNSASSKACRANSNHPTQKLRNIFDFNKSIIKKLASQSSKEGIGMKDCDSRPFNSSYYYAHNNPCAKGGYKDGLRTEDYTMNQPRLLSKEGVAVSAPLVENNGQDDSSNACKIGMRNTRNTPKTPSGEKNAYPSVAITKYLWEDTNDVSKIRIDTLPSSEGITKIRWEDANVSKSGVKSMLINSDRGILVLLTSHEDGGKADGIQRRSYHLRLPNLYGETQGVKTVWRKNKLLVKIFKKDGSKFPWPSLTFQGSTSGTNISRGDVIDGDLFRSGCGESGDEELEVMS